MSILRVRNVPPGVIEILRARAAAEGKPLSTYVAAELTRLASRPTNVDIAARLAGSDRTNAPDVAEILKALDDGRR